MRLAWLGAAATLTCVLVAGCASDAVPTDEPGSLGTATQAIQNGTVDSTNKYRYAVGVCAGRRGQCTGICSGALIAPNVVVTARHCVDDIDYKVPGEYIDCSKNPTFTSQLTNTFSVTTHYEMFGGSTGTPPWRSVTRIVRPTDDRICKNDIALLILDSLVPASEAKPVIPGVQYAMNDARYLSTFAAIGYGNVGPSESGAGGAGTRRFRDLIRVACVPGDPNNDCPATPQFQVGEFVAGDGTCSGDSGSSAFEEQSYLDNKNKPDRPPPISFGVLSRGGTSEDGTTCKGSVYTRLDAWRDLVINTVKAASNNWTLYPKPVPDWTVYVPPPPPSPTPTEPTEPTAPAKKGFAEACGADPECASGYCEQGACTETCTTNDDCPEGHACGGAALCEPGTTAESASSGATTTTTTEGCAVGRVGVGGGGAGAGAAALAMGGLALALAGRAGRRRRG